jgi:hypothetical protein
LFPLTWPQTGKAAGGRTVLNVAKRPAPINR